MRNILAINSSVIDGHVIIQTSDGRSVKGFNAEALLSWLALLQSDDYFIVTWDLAKFLSPIFELLPQDIKDKLNCGERAIFYPLRLFLSIAKGKFFGVNYKQRTHVTGNFYNEDIYDVNVYELKTFFPGIPSLTLPETVKHSKLLLKTLDSMGMKPTKLTSPAAIYEESILCLMPIPNIYTLPDKAIPMLEWCWNSIREWRSVYQIGIWPSGSVWDYDITSAYPSQIARLPNISKAEFIHTDGSIPLGPPQLQWGVLRGTVSIDADISPVISDDDTARSGAFPCLLPFEEWECIKRHGIGDFAPEEGWFFRVPNLQYLFDYPMKRLYSFRNSYDPLKNDIAKSASVSVWGKFQEMHGEKHGDFWNSIYACMVASRNRINVCDFIYDNKLTDSLISVTVDGSLCTKHLDIPSAKSFGQWRINPPSPAMVLTSSHQWVEDKRPNGKTVLEMIEEVKRHPSSRGWHSIHLATLEHDRYFKSLPKNGRDLLNNVYHSKPFSARVDGNTSD